MDEASLNPLSIPFIKVGHPEVLIGFMLGEQVINNHQDRMRHCDGSALRPPL